MVQFCGYSLFIPTFLAVFLQGISGLPTFGSSTDVAAIASVWPRDEVNPVAPSRKTIPDYDMPPLRDLGIMAKDNLSSYDDDAMTLTTTEFLPGRYQTRVHLANGYIGSSVAMAGPFFEQDKNQTNRDGTVLESWPMYDTRQTFGTVSGFFDSQAKFKGTNFAELQEYGWDSAISGIPHPLSFNFVINGQVLNSTVDPTTLSNFSQTLKFQDGLTEWHYTWSPKNMSVSFDIEFVSLFSRIRPNVASTQLRVTPRGGNFNASIIDLLDGRNARRSFLGQNGLAPGSSIFVSVHPDGLPNVTAFSFSTANVSNRYTDELSRREAIIPGNYDEITIGQQWDIHLIDGQAAVFEKFVGIASTDKFKNPAVTAENSSKSAFEAGWQKILSEHVQEWNRIMKRNLITSYRDPSGRLPVNDTTIEILQAAAVADRFFILQNLLPEDGSNLNDQSISVGGLTSDSYGGMIFWDAEVWMMRGIIATDPEYALQILKYRLAKYTQAKLNAQLPYVQEKYKFSEEAALYPWTSGRYGNATSTGPVMDYEYHLNADIALSMLWYRSVTGSETWFKEEAWPVVKSIGHAFATLLQSDGDGFSIFNMTDPDEFSNHENNGAFLLASVSTVLSEIVSFQEKHNLEINRTWMEMANNVNIPRAESGITLEYDDMPNNITVKQADIILLGPILDWRNNYTAADKIRDLDFYIQIQSPNGPAMTFAISSIAESLNAVSGCGSFTYELESRLPHYRGPWMLMSEQANDDVNENGGFPPAFPFITGHGGNLQIPLFGYLGLDLNKDVLTIQPSLPVIKYLAPPDFSFGGARFRATMNSTHTNLTRISTAGANGLNEALSTGPIPVSVGRPEGNVPQRNYTLAEHETITVENDMYWRNATTPNNLLQCQQTISKSKIVPGQLAGAATDGKFGTKWQPLTTDKALLTVALDNSIRFQQVDKIRLEWGPRTPLRARVGLTNSTGVENIDDENVMVIDIPNIVPSRVYGQDSTTFEVLPYVGNSTEYCIPTEMGLVWSGRYALLEIEGCQACGWDEWRLENGTVVLGDEDGFGATVSEFELIGALGSNLKFGMNTTADERAGLDLAKEGLVNSQSQKLV